MLRLKRVISRLVQIGRLATLGRVAGEVAHRIKAPLTTIAVDAEVLARRHAGDPDTLRELAEIGDSVERCKGILKDLLDLGRIEEMDVAPFDLREPARAALASIGTLAKSRRVRLSVSDLDAPLPARGDATLLREALARAALAAVCPRLARDGASRVGELFERLTGAGARELEALQ